MSTALNNYILGELDRQMTYIVQPGIIEEVDLEKARARFRAGEWVSAMLPYTTAAAGKVRTWCPPSKGEQCLLLSMAGRTEMGYIITGFYTEMHSAPENKENIISIHMPDDSKIAYDYESGELLVSNMKSVIIENSEEVTIKSTKVTINAEKVSISGDLNVDGDVLSGKISLQKHTHKYIKPRSDYELLPAASTEQPD